MCILSLPCTLVCCIYATSLHTHASGFRLPCLVLDTHTSSTLAIHEQEIAKALTKCKKLEVCFGLLIALAVSTRSMYLTKSVPGDHLRVGVMRVLRCFLSSALLRLLNDLRPSVSTSSL